MQLGPGSGFAVIVETARLRLRPPRETDFDEYATLVADPEVMRFIADGRPLSRDEAWRNLAMIVGHWSFRGHGLWLAEERASGRLVGRIGFFEPEGWPGFELGWLLARSHQARGLAQEGARACLDLAFSALGRERVVSVIHPDNAASIRLAERLGERFDRMCSLGGHTAAVYAIDRATWKATRPELADPSASTVAGGVAAPSWLGPAGADPSSGRASGEAASSDATRLEVNGLDHLYLTVLDLARSVGFWDPVMRLLGFRKGTAAIAGEPHVHYFNRWLQISLRPARSRVGGGATDLATGHEGGAAGCERGHDAYSPGLHHVCLRVDGVAEVNWAAARLRALGIEATAPKLYPEYAPDYYATFFTDPDGLRFELVATRSRRFAVRARWHELTAFTNPFDELAKT